METVSLDWVLTRDDAFRYQLLDRMRMDCAYFLGNGQLYGNHLWAGTIKEQIETMKAIWNSFSETGKPVWLTWEQIEKYQSEMEAMGVAWALEQGEVFCKNLLEKLGHQCMHCLREMQIPDGYLWAGAAEEQIKAMKILWHSFSEADKPEWPTWEQILQYEKEMCGNRS